MHMEPNTTITDQMHMIASLESRLAEIKGRPAIKANVKRVAVGPGDEFVATMTIGAINSRRRERTIEDIAIRIEAAKVGLSEIVHRELGALRKLESDTASDVRSTLVPDCTFASPWTTPEQPFDAFALFLSTPDPVVEAQVAAAVAPIRANIVALESLAI